MIKWENDSKDKKQHRREGTKNIVKWGRCPYLSESFMRTHTRREGEREKEIERGDDEVEESSDILNR